nr:NnrU family protein [Pontivivens insulae]
MALLLLGVTLWWGAHLLKRWAPAARAGLEVRFGPGARGMIAGLLGLSVLLMIIGYRGSDFVPLYTPPSWGVHINNLAMLVSIFLFGAGSSKGRARTLLRHPMLTGFLIWTAAHLLVNGDLSSVILFGGLGLWSVVQIFAINRATPEWHRPEPGAIGGDAKLVVITLVLFAIITGIHSIFIWPFPG